VGKRTAPLEPALEAMRRGDRVLARRRLDQTNVQQLNAGDRTVAERIREAGRIDRPTLWVGLGCVVLFGLVVLITALKQP
jgi:hypothetical protein